MTSSDPTDNALAAIASILDHPAENLPWKTDVKIETPPTVDEQITPAMDRPVAADMVDVDHYTKTGPGPIDEIRFRWSVRRDADGNYFVDETIGLNSRPRSIGPIPKQDVVQFIDDREREASQRFDALKNEMSTGVPADDRT